MEGRKWTMAGLVLLVATAAGCTESVPEPPEPTSDEPAVNKYDAIPYDPCAVIDLTGAETLLGPLEYDDYFNNGDAEPDSMQGWGETWCGAAFDDGTDQRAQLIIRLYIEDELVGEASEQKRGPDEGLEWPYGGDYEDQAEQIPEPLFLSVQSQWESNVFWQNLELRDDDYGWDPEGKSTAVQGVFSESNVWGYAYIWRSGAGASEAPDPEAYVAVLSDLADQVRSKLEVSDLYEGS